MGSLPISVPYQRFQLSNGLEVILHQDLRIPRVVVNVLYRVGAANDPKQRRGLAHLFEHLMFMGTTRIPEGRFDLMIEEEGGWNNAFTSEHHTVYYDVAPSQLLPRLLWAEADRMASLEGGIDGKKLALQRDVVLGELRQEYQNAPYGAAELALPSYLYPPPHPYSFPVIGTEADIRRIRLEDVTRHFRRYYQPSNASLVVAGAIQFDRTARLVERFFGWIPSYGKPKATDRHPAPKVTGNRHVLSDRVELPRLTLTWHSPALHSAGDAELDLWASMLADGKDSRLSRVLVFDKRLAHRVECYQWSRKHGSLFFVEVTGRHGVPIARLERETLATLRRVRRVGPTADELRRACRCTELGFVAGMERVVRRAELLNTYWEVLGEPDSAAADLARYLAASTAGIRQHVGAVLDAAEPTLVWVIPSIQPAQAATGRRTASAEKQQGRPTQSNRSRASARCSAR